MKQLIGSMLLAVLVWACASPAPAPSIAPTSSPIIQRLLCGDDLDQATCESAIANVIRAVPDNAQSTVAVVGLFNAPSATPAANSAPDDLLVSFAPLPGEDTWLNPPTWTVSSERGEVQPWRADQWPPHYVTLLVEAGLVSDAPAD